MRREASASMQSHVGFCRDASGNHIAYGTLGEGARDVLWMPNFFTPVDAFTLSDEFRRFAEALAAPGRLVLFDQPGTGASDVLPAGELPTMERWGDAVQVVLDHLGIDRISIVAEDSAGPQAMMFAAAHPERVERLVLVNTFARWLRGDGYTVGLPTEYREIVAQRWAEGWGKGEQLRFTAPSLAKDPYWTSLVACIERIGLRQNQIRPLAEMVLAMDVRDILPTVRVPTTIIHRTENPLVRLDQARYLAEHLPNATLVEVSGDVHFAMLDTHSETMKAILEAVTGVATAADDSERVLVTVLFTDIVDSTVRAAELGDKAWREVLDRCDRIMRTQVEASRGKLIKNMGDGHLATFDGPGRAVRCAHAVRDAVAQLGISIRAGLHCGEVEPRGDDIGGLAVHVGARVMSLAAPGEVVASQTVKDLTIGSGIGFEDRGTHELKGVPGEWRLYAALTV